MDRADERARAIWSIWYVRWIRNAAANANTTCQSSFWRTLIPSPVFAFR